MSLQAQHYIPEVAIDKLFSFLCVFFKVIGRFSPFVALLAKKLPTSSQDARTNLGLVREYKKFVVCPKCWKLFSFEDSIEECGSIRSTKHCNFVAYPNHTQRARRTPCNADLLKKVELASGKNILHPYKMFCYRSLKSTLQDFLQRPDFQKECEHWRSKLRNSGCYEDIYDAKMWMDFQNPGGQPFLSLPYTYGLTLNIDWFQPFSHTVYSVGAIYMSILNLPRHIRNKRQNMMLIGVIPGPSEPLHDINALLDPLVSELKEFWHGVSLNVHTEAGPQNQIVRCALLCVACDLPAGRKVCGFLSHAAAKGCSKCSKTFSGTVGNMCYSGFDRSLWTPRTNHSHRRDVKVVQGCNTKTGRSQKESELGCRYSILLELPYFDPPRMLALDPMHNLFLGTGKHMINIWRDRGLICDGHLDGIQKFVNGMKVPCDIGRIPRKIESGFSGFKADQFKSWITLFSIPALFDILPAEHLECWRHYVLACRILCQNKISMVELDLADALLMQFCRRVERMYGSDIISPNMHMHGHLKESVLDFGPVQEFWLFSFERYNGILGKQPNNNKDIESQLMSRFLRDSLKSTISYPEEFEEEFKPVCESLSVKVVGSVLDTFSSNSLEFPHKFFRSVLPSDEINILEKLISKLREEKVEVNSIFLKYSSLVINSYKYSSSGKRITNHAVVLASWDSELYGNPPTPPPSSGLHQPSNKRPVNVQYYMKVYFSNDSIADSMVFAFVAWFYPHPEQNALGKPAEFWCSRQYESFGIHSFVPIVHGIIDYKHEPLLVVVPLVE